MINRLRESRWAYILLSILLAFVFWYYVRAELDPSQPTWFRDVEVEIVNGSVLTRQGLTVSELSQDTVDLYIEAPASIREALIRNRAEITVTVDVSRCVEGENKLSYDISWPESVNVENNNNVAVLERDPSVITVTVDKLYTQTFDVEFQLKGSVAKGYQAGTAVLSPETVTVSGSVDQVSQVAKVVAILEEEELDERFAGDLPLTLLDGDGNVLTDLEVTLDTESVYVVLPIVVVKEIPLTVNVIPGGGATEDDVKIKIEPKTITVSGAEEDLENLTEISLGSVDLSKVMGTTSITKEVALDPSLENVSGITSAVVTVTVEGLATRNIDVDNISPSSDIPSGYTVTFATQVKTVTVRGKQEAVDALDASQIRIVADLSDIASVGTYPVPVKVYVDAEGVGVVGEYSIVVNVSR